MAGYRAANAAMRACHPGDCGSLSPQDMTSTVPAALPAGPGPAWPQAAAPTLKRPSEPSAATDSTTTRRVCFLLIAFIALLSSSPLICFLAEYHPAASGRRPWSVSGQERLSSAHQRNAVQELGRRCAQRGRAVVDLQHRPNVSLPAADAEQQGSSPVGNGIAGRLPGSPLHESIARRPQAQPQAISDAPIGAERLARRAAVSIDEPGKWPIFW